jgi:hypothetical protein
MGASVNIPIACRGPPVTIARRRTTTLDALGVAVPAPVAAPAGVRRLDVPVTPRDVPAPEAVAPAGRLRRCTFRRVDTIAALSGRMQKTSYVLVCLYGDSDSPLALGDVDAARPVCEACTATGIFRPDEA